MKIDDLKANISKRNGLATNNHYKIILTPPAGITGYSMSDLSILCDSVVMPGRNISTTEYNTGKQTLKTPYTFIDSDVTATFLLTGDNMARKFFEEWMDYIFDTEGYTVRYKGGRDGTGYAKPIEIHQLNKNDELIQGVRLINAYPTNINEYTLSNAEENSVSKIDVTFAYDNFVKI